ncbi:hypothetical protein Hamer_G015964 [Homarus americanus]|uniref:Uncharacterized protein n=1 Tax=Homarus americanus TaxID=6706 RepID=A0A8J5JBN5_HOMAM|nr:hypothetical protein Hamer_G015964 [Homarus americanus]
MNNSRPQQPTTQTISIQQPPLPDPIVYRFPFLVRGTYVSVLFPTLSILFIYLCGVMNLVIVTILGVDSASAFFLPMGGLMAILGYSLTAKARKEYNALPPDHPDRLMYSRRPGPAAGPTPISYHMVPGSQSQALTPGGGGAVMGDSLQVGTGDPQMGSPASFRMSTYPSPHGGQPATYPPPHGGQPATYPSPHGGQPATYPPPYEGQPATYPPPYGEQPATYPSPHGGQPATYPPSYGGQPATSPPPYGGQPTIYTSPYGGQPATCPPPYAGIEGRPGNYTASAPGLEVQDDEPPPPYSDVVKQFI